MMAAWHARAIDALCPFPYARGPWFDTCWQLAALKGTTPRFEAIRLNRYVTALRERYGRAPQWAQLRDRELDEAQDAIDTQPLPTLRLEGAA